MSTAKKVAVVSILVLEAALALLGASICFGLTAEYGDIGASRAQAFGDALSGGILGLALALVGLAGLVAALVGRRRWITMVAVAIPTAMVVFVWASGPWALQQKRDVQYDAAPHCDAADLGAGPGVDAARASQEAFDSIEHVGWFSAGGSSGVVGCDRAVILTEPTDIVAHYEATLRGNGWRIVTVDADHLRAERGSMAFELVGKGNNWTVWAGPVAVEPNLEQHEQVDGSGDASAAWVPGTTRVTVPGQAAFVT